MPRKRQRIQEYQLLSMPVNKPSIDLSSDANFLYEYIPTSNPFVGLLLSHQLTNESFTDLYEKSQQTNWQKLLTDLRDGLNNDERNKPKRLIFNRLISECTRNLDAFQTDVESVNTQIKTLMTDFILSEYSIADIYKEIKHQQQLQSNQRLFAEDCYRKCTLLTLQRIMTDYFIRLLLLINQYPNYTEFDVYQAMRELLINSLITIVQPSGTDCPAVIRYEKNANEFVTKIRTRTICLLDITRINNCFNLLPINVSLQLKNREPNSIGDVQLPICWQTRTVICSDDQQRTFLYFDLTDNDAIKLTIKSSNGKPAYNNNLCELEYKVTFEIQTNKGTLTELVTKTTECFGLCSHAKYSTKYLTQVFIDEINRRASNTTFDTHLNTLECYIEKFYQRITSVQMKTYTKTFIHEQLDKTRKAFDRSTRILNSDVMIFSFDHYSTNLEGLFLPMKFLNTQTFLSLMYYDDLFRGICSDKIDKDLESTSQLKPQFFMRFAQLTEQETPDYPNIIIAIYNDTLVKSRVTHQYVVTDISFCICESIKSSSNELKIFDQDKILPFSNFRWYYDSALNRDNIIQKIATIQYFPVKSLFRNIQEINNQYKPFIRMTGDPDFKKRAMVFLEQQFAYFCQINNTQSEINFFQDELDELCHIDFSELNTQDNI